METGSMTTKRTAKRKKKTEPTCDGIPISRLGLVKTPGGYVMDPDLVDAVLGEPQAPGYEHDEPLRPGDSLATEAATYESLLEIHNKKGEIVAAHGPEDVKHRATCSQPSICQHGAHVRPRRPWTDTEVTQEDLRHLGRCIEDEAMCSHPSHRLPPRPPIEYCCAQRCHPKDSPEAHTDCVSIPAREREFRKAEMDAFGEGPQKGFVGGVILRRDHRNPNTMWKVSDVMVDGHHGQGSH
jgi:hypothetical protein